MTKLCNQVKVVNNYCNMFGIMKIIVSEEEDPNKTQDEID